MSSLYELTPLADRRRFDEQLAARLLQAEQQGQRFAVLLVAADSMAWINRRWGRPAGDSVLRKLGRRLLASLAADDLLVRYEGNRFGVIRWAPSADQAVAFAQHLVSRVANTPFDIPDSRDAAFLTSSIGITVAGPVGDPAAIVAIAEAALLRAKGDGGNRVVVG